MMPLSGAKAGGVATGHAYQAYQDFSSYEDDGQNMAAGFAAEGEMIKLKISQLKILPLLFIVVSCQHSVQPLNPTKIL